MSAACAILDDCIQSAHTHTLGYCEVVMTTPTENNRWVKGEETMENQTLRSERNHLQNRLWSIYEDKKHQAMKDFGLLHDNPPHSWPDLLKRIEDKKFVLDEKDVNRADRQKDWYGPFYGVTWKDPDKVEDQEGFDAWAEKLETARARVLDDTAILEPKEALDSLRAFETATFN